MLVLLIGSAELALHGPRQCSSDALAVLVVVQIVVVALVPAHRMMDRVPDLMELQGMLTHVVR
jgi:hypothetical protein